MKRYTVNEAINDAVTSIIENDEGNDATLIRTRINDLNDAAEKRGLKANHRYNQEAAIKIARDRLQARRRWVTRDGGGSTHA